MKQILNKLLLLAAILSFTSCDYLNVDPELGLDEDEVFTVWENYQSYFYSVYGGMGISDELTVKLGFPLWIDMNERRYTWYSLTDMCDTGRLIRAQQIKSGVLGENADEWTTVTSQRPISRAMFRIIRVANKAIENADRVKNAPDNSLDELLGEAYFIRAFAHFVLCRTFGGMPYLTHALTAEDEWDMERLSANETYRLCAKDFECAYEYFQKAGKVRRDPLPGADGHLATTDMYRPNGVAAMAFRARAMLYAASPLNNVNGIKDWEDAAIACAEAIDIAEDNGYAMVPFNEWNSNYFGTKYTNEMIWGWNLGTYKTSYTLMSAMYAYPASNYSKGSGDCPTQNFVDLFETVFGEPLRTEEERQEAVSAGHYNDQNPYINRDPRLNKTIVHDGSIVEDCPNGINIYYDPVSGKYPTSTLSGNERTFGIEWGSNDSMGYSNTGYYVRKNWNGRLGTTATYQHSDPLMRMAELYLNYAETVNEAYGPNGKAGNLSMTALDALDKVRDRAGMLPVLDKYRSSTELLRDRIRNERTVELAFEGDHYFFDIRRWMIAPQTMTQTLMGMYVEKVDVCEEYPIGRRFERRAIPSNRQANWKNAMYYFPFPTAEANKMMHFVNNEIW